MHRRRNRDRKSGSDHGFLGKSRNREERKPRAPAPAPAAAPAGKRRARPDAIVPEELKLSRVRKPAPTPPAPKPAQSHPAPKPAQIHPAAKPAQTPPAQSHPAPKPADRHPGRRNRGNDPGSSSASSKVILVTGFECFGGEKINPSWEICQRLPREIAGMRVETCLVPCEFRRAIEVAAEAIERHHPSMVISLGQAGGRSRIGVERVSINVDDARIPDNVGAQPLDEPIAANGPPAYFATVPVKAMTQAIRAAGIPAEVSNSAGTYVCNHVMYGVLHFLAASGNKARAGFIHVPFAEAQVLDKKDVPAMSIESMTRGIAAAIEAAVHARVDIASAEGALD
jgi:pyroglutamyl-peptidase